jgi:hypothetical protein
VAEGGDGDLRYKMSKESVAKTLSLLLQDNFSGRAEIGLIGDDDFHFKVSPDGSAWFDALLIGGVDGATKVNGGFFLTGALSPSQIAADQNDYNPAGLAGAGVLRLSSDATRNLTGLSGGGSGRVVALVNVGSNQIVLIDASASSSAVNRFAFGSDTTLDAGESALLWYDATDSRWKLLAGPGAAGEGGGGGDVTGPGSSTDNAVVRFNGTSGASIQSSGVSISDGNVLAGAVFGNSDLKLRDADASHTLTITPGSDLTANRVFTLATGDAARTLDISAGDVTVSAAGAALLDDPDAATQRTTLGLGTADSPQFAGLNIGHAGDTTLTRVSAGVAAIEGSNILLASGLGSITQAFDADTLKADVSDDLTAGFTSTSSDQGTKSSGTFTPNLATGNVQHFTNGGAFTLAPPSGHGSLVLDQTNNASAGAITRSGFTKVTGDSLTTSDGHKFRHFITVGNAGSHCHTQAMQ